MKKPLRANARFLHRIFRRRLVVDQPSRQIVGGVEVNQYCRLKVAVLIGVGGIGIQVLPVAIESMVVQMMPFVLFDIYQTIKACVLFPKRKLFLPDAIQTKRTVWNKSFPRLV